MLPEAVHYIVKGYAAQVGLVITPHDCRRTMAQHALAGGAPMEQIQLTLGHASAETTRRYLNEAQNLTDAPCDHLGFKL